jgi:HSP20 family protein
MSKQIEDGPSARPVVDVVGPRRREIDRLMQELSPLFADGDKPLPAHILLDVVETPDGLRLMAEVPGLEPGDLDVSVLNDVLTLHGRKSCDGACEGAKARLSECGHGEFTRTVELPTRADLDRITASLGKGVLTIQVPYGAQPQPRKIAVTETD